MDAQQTRGLGVLGLGSRSTLFYLEQLNQQYLAKHGGYSTCPLTLINTNFNAINKLLPHYSDDLKVVVQQYLDQLQDVHDIIIPNITLHDVVDRLNAECHNKYPIIHPVKETLDQLRDNGVKQVTLVASQYSMTSPYLLKLFAEKQIQVSVPPLEDQLWLDAFRQKTYASDESTIEIARFIAYIHQLRKTSKVVIACTELSLMLPAESASNQSGIYDMARIQIDQYFH